MPPPFSMTSPVAVATTRILAAYLSNHRLSPAEAVSLSGTIADTLAGLISGAGVKRDVARAPADEPSPRWQSEPQETRTAQAITPEVPAAAALPAPVPEPIVEPDAEPEPEPEAEAMAEQVHAPQPEAQPESAAAPEVPRKRKRPSRPRSRRGKGAASPEDAVIEAPPEIEVAPEPMVADGVAEEPAAMPKPRRAPGRPRRVTTV